MIESTENKTIKHIKKLNSQTKFRKQENQFVVENKQAIIDIITNHQTLIMFVVATEKHRDLAMLAKKKNVAVYRCSKQCAYHMASVKEPIGCFAVIQKPEFKLTKDKSRLAIALYKLKSPSNCGAIIRNAHAFGCNRIYLIGPCCDPFHPESIRAAAGNIMNIPIIKKESIESLSRYTCWKVDTKASTPLKKVPKSNNMCFILGSEAGFDEDNRSTGPACYIPMKHNTDSLNVAATSAIILYHYAYLIS